MENHIAKGERHGNARLTEASVREIRKAIGSLSEIARKYGISQQWCAKIRSQHAWKHLSEDE